MIALAQTAPTDTLVYEVPDTLPYPLMKSCQLSEHAGWTTDSSAAAPSRLLTLMARNIRYPEAARQTTGRAAWWCPSFGERDGRMSQYKLLKDIGDGCGEESLRVLKALEEAGMRWQPGLVQGKPVRARQSLPIRFRLQEALPYYLSEQGDTIYTVIEAAPVFAGAWIRWLLL